MKILLIDNSEERSRQEAINRGCTGTTTYWWAYNEQGILFYNEDYSGLSEEEINSLVDYTYPEEL